MGTLAGVSYEEMVSLGYNQFFQLILSDNLLLNFVSNCRSIVIHLIAQQIESLLFTWNCKTVLSNRNLRMFHFAFQVLEIRDDKDYHINFTLTFTLRSMKSALITK